jgi:hypothetical protein
MNTRRHPRTRSIASIGSACVLALFTIGCPRRPEINTQRTLRQAMDPKMERGIAKVELIGGYLKIESTPPASAEASKDLCVADIKTSHEAMVPKIEVATVDGVSTFSIGHAPYVTGLGPVLNEWRVGLVPDRPLELTARLMSGICELKLGGMQVTKLDVHVDQSQLSIDFGNAPITTSCEVVAEIATGQLRVRYPADPTIGVRVRARKAVGGVQVDGLRAEKDTFVNEAFATAKVKLDLALGSGFGEVVVEPATKP